MLLLVSELDGALLIETVQKTARSFITFPILIDDKEGKRNDFQTKLEKFGGLEENVKHMDLEKLRTIDFYFTHVLADKLHRKST